MQSSQHPDSRRLIQPNAQSRQRIIIGIASCLGASNDTCQSAPMVLQHLQAAKQLNADWKTTLSPPPESENALSSISQLCQQIASETEAALLANQFFIIFGGDHSCAIGTWSGVTQVIDPDELGLIWIDAHMDAHTPDTSPSGAIHGMPVACLLGSGPAELTRICNNGNKILPQNLVQIGIRSYEDGETQLLKQNKVKILFMDEVRQIGMEAACQQAIDHLKTRCRYVGVSIDLDAIDPIEAPGVGSVASHGIATSQLKAGLILLTQQLPVIGCEIVELNPTRDINNKTAQLAIELAHLLSS